MNSLWILSGILVVVSLASIIILAMMARRHFQRESGLPNALPADTPRSDNPAVFMAASMQAVIKKLKEQEKELEALHRAERERAQQTERMSEAVTRNMPAGLLLVNSTGLITSANPAAEAALGVKSLASAAPAKSWAADRASPNWWPDAWSMAAPIAARKSSTSRLRTNCASLA